VSLAPDWRAALLEGSRYRPGRWQVAGCAYLPCAPMGGGPVSPVDEDADGSLLAAAVSQHLREGTDAYLTYAALPFRNSAPAARGPLPYLERSVWPREQAIERSGVAIYHVAGWYDTFTRDAVLAYHNLDTPKRLTIGPWFHDQIHAYDKAAEALRWFDHWLKGVENGVQDEAPIHYWTSDAPPGREWRAARHWPPPEARLRDWYLGSGPSGSIRSANDGLLTDRPVGGEGRDDYRVDYTVTLGASNRWTAAAGGAPGPVSDYPDLAEHDRRALTYTSAPLAAGLEVTGHPVLRLWVSSDTRDLDLFAVLSEVRPDGYSDYVTEGWLRASHRALAPPPYDRLGLPYHRSYAEDAAPLGAEPVELVFDLLPTSKVFRAGHRIRLTIAGADNGNFATPVTLPPPRLSVHRGRQRASALTLPVVEPGR
jgi:putative CocE/NonD family hydrolase